MNGTGNPPGQPLLRRRVRVHAASLAAMRDALGAPTHALALRALAREETTDPSLALLDAWAVVCDVVAFYSERIANEGYLRTATERRSVRELARTLGYELRPGVAASVDLAFHVEAAPGAPEVVHVPSGTAAQSVPGQGQLPQTFETSDDLEARAGWNTVSGVAVEPQVLHYGIDQIWLAAPTTTLRPGDSVLIVGAERRAGSAGDDLEKWDFRTVHAVDVEPEGYPGWTRLSLDRAIGYRRARTLVAEREVTVHALTERTQLFGATAPDPALLVTGRDTVPPGIEPTGTGADATYRWKNYDAVDPDRPDEIELDGDHQTVLPDSWIVIDQPGLTEAYRVRVASAEGASRYGVSGRITRVRVDVPANLAGFRRRQAMVHCASVPLPATTAAPLDGALRPGPTLRLLACEPLLPARRLIIVQGTDYETGAPLAETTRVVGCTVDAAGELGAPTMTVTVAPALTGSYRPGSLVVHANVAPATHGETVQQVLGSGDSRTAFRRFTLRRGPLTWVRARTPQGARPDLEVRVDGVRWDWADDLEQAGPQDRVYAVRKGEAPDGAEEWGPVQLVQGDGVHGAVASTGTENITATYRVGLGSAGAMAAGQITLLVRRPLGIHDVVNPGPSHDWAAAETLEEARRNAPQRVRTLDRVVSVADYGDLARAYAGIGQARAELVWDGTGSSVAVTVLGTGGREPSGSLLSDLRGTLDDARDPVQPLAVLPGHVLWFGVRVDIDYDPAYVPTDVAAAVRAALATQLSVSVRDFAAPVTAAGVLVVVRGLPGVRACSMPRLVDLGDDETVASQTASGVRAWPTADSNLLLALGAHWEAGILPAQIRALWPGAVELGVLA